MSLKDTVSVCLHMSKHMYSILCLWHLCRYSKGEYCSVPKEIFISRLLQILRHLLPVTIATLLSTIGVEQTSRYRSFTFSFFSFFFFFAACCFIKKSQVSETDTLRDTCHARVDASNTLFHMIHMSRRTELFQFKLFCKQCLYQRIPFLQI